MEEIDKKNLSEEKKRRLKDYQKGFMELIKLKTYGFWKYNILRVF